MPSLCSLCSQIAFLDLPPFPVWLGGYHVPLAADSELIPFLPDDHDVIVSASNLGIPHHPSLPALQEAAASCEICALIDQSVGRVRKLLDEAQNNKHFMRYDRSGGPLYEFFMSKRREGEDGLLVWSMSKNNNEAFLLGAIGYCVDDESPLKDHFRGRPIVEDPTSQTVINRMCNWVGKCNENHPKCCYDNVELPLRVLDVADPSSSPGMIKLAEPKGLKGRYATLSHCWGHSSKFTTTNSTLAARKAGITVSDIPKTFRDAIEVARYLDIRYIWIDSLCICQDDSEDWERESAKMASIYANSYISIAASRTANDSTGFLNPRTPREYVELPVVLHPPIAEGVKSSDIGENSLSGTIRLFNIPLNYAANGTGYVKHNHEPLTARAWVLQERCLAPRTLHFGSSQMSFECLDVFETEDGYRCTQHMFNVDELVKEPRHDSFYRGSDRWYDLIYEYSERKLTKETDKLPALSGLASMFRDRHKDQYFAGLWKSQLIEGLCWQCFGDTHTRPKEYRAPSWSWASVNGLLSITRIGGWIDLVEVLDVQVEARGQNPVGEVSSGSLTLRGTMEKMRLSEEPNPDEEAFPHVRFVRMCSKEGKKYGWNVSFDIEAESAREKVKELDMYLVPLVAKDNGPTKEGSDWSCFGLMVVPDETKKRCYKRMGFCILEEAKEIEKWVALKTHSELTTIVLV